MHSLRMDYEYGSLGLARVQWACSWAHTFNNGHSLSMPVQVNGAEPPPSTVKLWLSLGKEPVPGFSVSLRRWPELGWGLEKRPEGVYFLFQEWGGRGFLLHIPGKAIWEGEISGASVTPSFAPPFGRRISVTDKSKIHLSSLFPVFLSPLPSSSPSLFPFILASPSPLSPLKETFPLPSFPQGQHPKPPSSLFIDTYSLQLPCWDFQFLGDLTASNINTSSFPRYLLSPLMWAHNLHFIYRLNYVQSQNNKVNNPSGLCIPFFVTWASLLAQLGKNLPAMWEAWVQSLGWEDPLEKGKAAHSNILAWRIPWTI